MLIYYNNHFNFLNSAQKINYYYFIYINIKLIDEKLYLI
jgi:hypothetical protein